MPLPSRPFLGGVVEGFYGQPWTPTQRQTLFARLRAWGLNTYFYAPKDDLHHRALWRQPYDAASAEHLADTLRDCHAQGLRFIYGLAPGLDITFTNPADLRCLETRLHQLLDLGCRDFALLFDDIPDRMSEADRAVHGSFARAQAAVTTALHARIAPRCPEGRFLFCPTPYCGRMARAGLGGPNYLAELGDALPPSIDIFWTGPEIVSPRIDVPSILEVGRQLRRPPVLWDNLHANDYDLRRVYLGPYSGRDPALRPHLAGVLTNPNCEFEVNHIAIRTLARWLKVAPDAPWDPRTEFLAALREWWPDFAAGPSAAPAIPFDDLVLFADCLYLPGADGPGADQLWDDAARLLGEPPSAWGPRAARFRDAAGRILRVCDRLTEVRRREIFYALNRRAWELKEELALLLGAIAWRERHGSLEGFTSDFHRPPTFRGGFMRRLETLLDLQNDGSFRPGPALR